MSTDQTEAEDWRDRNIAAARGIMAHCLGQIERGIRDFRLQAARLGDGGPGSGTLYDVEWVEGPGERYAAAVLDRMEADAYLLRKVLAEGQR